MINRKWIITLIIISVMAGGCSGGLKTGKARDTGSRRWLVDREILGLLAEERYDRVVSLTDSLLLAGEEDPRLLGQRAFALGMTGQEDQAISMFEKAILEDYQNWWNHFAFARLLAGMGRIGRALSEFREARRFCEGRECAEVNRNLAVTYIETGRNSDAYELIKEGLRENPRNSYLIGLKAVMEARAEPERADTLLMRVAAMDGIDRGVFMELGGILINSGRPEAAALAFRKAWEQDRKDYEAGMKLSHALRESGDYQEASEVLINLPPSDTVTVELARTRLRQGKFSEALEIFRTAGESEAVLEGMAVAYWKLGKLDKAERYGRRALDMNPESVSVMINLAAIYGAAGKLEKAERLLDRVLEIDSGNRAALENLRRLKEAQGNGGQ